MIGTTAGDLLSPLHLPCLARTLGNGLRVVVHQDRTSPLVAVHLMYHVGSRNERPGRTGLAHLLEHLLFEGSENCPKGDFDRLLERAGGTNNGSTWLDRTNYYETVPSHAVELALWLERERMAHFLPVLSGEMLEVQRGVVINERRQAYENRPYGMADERLHQLLFPQEHPYSWPTIGYMEDLEAITLEDARSFFSSFYTPSNAVLVLAGDLEPEDAFRAAERYFGDLPSGPPLPEAPQGIVRDARGARREVMEDRVSFPRYHLAFPVPSYGTPEWIALDVLAYLLADGDSSRLHRALVRDLRLTQDIDTFLYPTELNGVFGVVATARSGVTAEQVETAVWEVLGRVAEDGVSAQEVAGALRRLRRDQIANLSTVEGRAEELAYAATVLGDAGELERMMGDYARVTPADVQRCASLFLREDNAATLVVIAAENGGGQ